MNPVEKIIKKLDLKPHPEGGFFKETYRSKGEILEDCLGKTYHGKRNYSTSIYFLLTSDTFSAFHRIQQDEIWHFYDGSPIKLHSISEDGTHSEFIIGNDILNGQTPQLVVAGGHWFAAEVINKNDYSLVGCTVSPGFSFDDFELSTQEKLMALFPQHKKIIQKLSNH